MRGGKGPVQQPLWRVRCQHGTTQARRVAAHRPPVRGWLLQRGPTSDHPGATHTRPGDRRHRCRGDLRHPWHGGFLEDRELVGLVRDVQCLGGFCKTVPERLVGLACIPNHDPEIAAAGLRRAAKLGLKGADFGVSTAVKPIWHRDWDPLWAAADECGMPISFHTTGFSLREPLDEQMARAMTHHTGPLRSQFFRSPGPSSSPASFSRGPWSGTQG